MIQNALVVPIGSTVATERVEIRFFINGNIFSSSARGPLGSTNRRTSVTFRGDGTDRGLRDSDTTWTILSSDESLGRLWDNTDPSHLLIAASIDSHIICSFGESDPPMTAR